MIDLKTASEYASLLVPIVMLLGLVVTVVIPFLRPVRRWVQPRLKGFVTEITGVNELRTDMNKNHREALDAIRDHRHELDGTVSGMPIPRRPRRQRGPEALH